MSEDVGDDLLFSEEESEGDKSEDQWDGAGHIVRASPRKKHGDDQAERGDQAGFKCERSGHFPAGEEWPVVKTHGGEDHNGQRHHDDKREQIVGEWADLTGAAQEVDRHPGREVGTNEICDREGEREHPAINKPLDLVSKVSVLFQHNPERYEFTL